MKLLQRSLYSPPPPDPAQQNDTAIANMKARVLEGSGKVAGTEAKLWHPSSTED